MIGLIGLRDDERAEQHDGAHGVVLWSDVNSCPEPAGERGKLPHIPRMRSLPLPDLLRGLILQRGWSTTAAAHAARISPVAAQRWCSSLTSAATTWLRMVSTFRAEVRISRGDDTWVIPAPPASPQVRERLRRSWRQRRFIHYLRAVTVQNPRLKRTEREQKARTYVANEEARLVSGVEDARRRMSTVLLAGEISGMRESVQALIRASHITPDELAFASGVSTEAAAAANEAEDDGRLLPLRRLLAALDARLEIRLPSANQIVIARSSSEPVHSRKTPTSFQRTPQRTSASTNHDGSNVRSTLDREAILALYDAGTPITVIADKAGISRQRVHSIAKSSGRHLRRAITADLRAQQADMILA